MQNKKMPVVFVGHGSPMLALEHTDITKELQRLGKHIIENYGRPKAVLMISAHWYTRGTYVQSTESPEQVYDMYGFPKELYDFKYTVKGSSKLTNRVLELLGDGVSVNDRWGIDHGTWTVLCHVFPEADIPVVQLSADGILIGEAIYETGKSLSILRDEGYLIMASGNIVHNLHQVQWDNSTGSPECIAFNDAIIGYVLEQNHNAIINYKTIPHASYAVPTPDHFLPLIYCLGASEGEKAKVFNNHCELGSISMTGFIFE